MSDGGDEALREARGRANAERHAPAEAEFFEKLDKTSEASILLHNFDWMRADLVDNSLCDVSDGLRSLVLDQLTEFRLKLVEFIGKS